MSDITLSKAVRSNLLSLQNTADLMATTQNRLATGKKVNSALDNPTNFFTASSLNSRAGDINQLLDGMANGIQTLEAADNGLKAITKTLESMQSTLRQARQDKSFQTASYTLDAEAIKAGAAGGTISLSGGAIPEGDTASFDIRKGVQGSTTAAARYNVSEAFPDLGTGPTLTATETYAPVDLSAANTVEFTVQGPGDAAAVTVSIDNAAIAGAADETAVSQDELVSAINAELEGGTSTVRARVTDNNIEFYDSAAPAAGNTGAGAEITVGGTDFTALGFSDDDGAGGTLTEVSAAGTDARTSFEFAINGVDISLTATEDTADKAAAAINTQLRAGGVEDVTASVKNGKLVVSGSQDGTTAVTLTASTDADHTGDLDAIFGASASRDVKDAAAATAAGADVKSVDELVAEINSRTLANGDANPAFGSVRASNDNGKLRIENLSTQGLDVGGVGTSGSIDGVSSSIEDAVGGNTVRADLSQQYNELRDQLDKLADDASFNGINLLRGDNLKITFNEIGTSEIDIQSKEGKSINSSSLGIPTNMEEADFDSDATIDNFLGDIKTALNEVRSQSSAFGSSLSIVQNRQDFSKNMINTLQTGASNLTLADSNEEAANLLALQTRQQLSSTALSMASQQDQAVLRLF